MTDTKTPFIDAGDGRIFGADGKLIAQAMGLHSADECLANIAFIVRACNAHEAMVEACKAGLDLIENPNTQKNFRVLSTIKQLKAALSLA